jgi:hypothetical protein
MPQTREGFSPSSGRPNSDHIPSRKNRRVYPYGCIPAFCISGQTNKKELIMNTRKIFVYGLLAVIFTLALTACDILNPDDDDNGDGTTFTSVRDFRNWYLNQPDNTPDEPYRAKLNIKDANASVDSSGAGLGLLFSSQYVFLDFSDSTFTKISGGAFSSCTTLVGIILPNTVTSIEYSNSSRTGAFQGCTNLTSVTLPANPGFTSIVSNTFSGCTKLDGVIIPDSVTSIEQSAFARTGLTGITIPNSVTSLSGFRGCTGLTEITIPNSVTAIGSNAFNETSLTSVTIPSSVTSIASGAFHITSLTSVTFEGTIPKNNFIHQDITANSESFLGDLRNKFYATDIDNGTPGTYTKSGNTWTLEPQE